MIESEPTGAIFLLKLGWAKRAELSHPRRKEHRIDYAIREYVEIRWHGELRPLSRFLQFRMRQRSPDASYSGMSIGEAISVAVSLEFCGCSIKCIL